MENRNDILTELQLISPLVAGLEPVNPFTVPAGYFDALPGNILAKIRGVATASAEIYQVPAGYFEDLAENILLKIKAASHETRDELNEVAPLLNTISRGEVFSIPAGYFEQANLAETVRNAKRDVKVVRMRKANRWMQYMAAAMMAGILVTGAFLFTDTNPDLSNEKNERLDISSELNKVSEADLVTYVNNPEHAAAAPATTQLASEDELAEVKHHIKQVSDDELNQYMKENGEAFDTIATEKEKEN
jgi:hypothetical protein